jgi:TonB family protein
MSSLAHAQGGLRPAFHPEPAFHPGLQVHAIAEPKADTRLSFLISAFCYTALAGLVALTVQHRETILKEIRTHGTVILDPLEARLGPPLAPVPTPTAGAAAPPDASLPAARATDLPPDALPDTLPTANHAGQVTDRGGIPGLIGVGGSGEPAGHGNASAAATGGVLEISGTQVQVLRQAEPVYPHMARILKIQGDVVVRMTIDTAGAPSEVTVVAGPEQLRAEALRCARQWRFTPARVGGEAVPAAFNLTLRFILR